MVATQTLSRVWDGNDKRARDLNVAQGAGCAPLCMEMERYCNISGNRGRLWGFGAEFVVVELNARNVENKDVQVLNFEQKQKGAHVSDDAWFTYASTVNRIVAAVAINEFFVILTHNQN